MWAEPGTGQAGSALSPTALGVVPWQTTLPWGQATGMKSEAPRRLGGMFPAWGLAPSLEVSLCSDSSQSAVQQDTSLFPSLGLSFSIYKNQVRRPNHPKTLPFMTIKRSPWVEFS